MSPTKIETPREFFDHVVRKDVDEFRSNATDLRLAYHACTSLLSLRDWIAHEHKKKSWTHSGRLQSPFSTPNNLRAALKNIDDRFGIVTDIANASKHMVLDPNRPRDTELWGNANTEVHFTGYVGFAPLGAVPLGGSASVIMVKIGSHHHDVLDCVNAVHSIWEQLMIENGW